MIQGKEISYNRATWFKFDAMPFAVEILKASTHTRQDGACVVRLAQFSSVFCMQ